MIEIDPDHLAARAPRSGRLWLVPWAPYALFFGLRLLSTAWPLPWQVHDPVQYLPAAVFPAAALALCLIAPPPLAWQRRVTWLVLAVSAALVAHDYRRGPDVAAEPAERMPRLKLVSFNLFQGRQAESEIFTYLEREAPDILALQELPEKVYGENRSWFQRQFRNHSYGHGLLLATRGQIEAEPAVIGLGHDRHALLVRVRFGEQEVSILNAHLLPVRLNKPWRIRQQQAQVARLVAEVEQATGPWLLAGDFNLPPGSTSYLRLEGLGASAFDRAGHGFGYSFPARFPVTRIDHVFGSAGVWFHEAAVQPVHLSDHRPVVVVASIGTTLAER